MIKVLLGIILFFVLLFLESFFLKIFSFSVFIILVISMYKRIDDIIFYPFITLFGIVLDTILHTPLGVHTLVIILLLLFVDIFWFFVHRDQWTGYIGIFLFIISYYLLVPVVSSLLDSGVFSEISISRVVGILIVSLISVGICILVDRFVKSIRDDKRADVIRLR